jgi:hypothetical protein
MSPTGKKARRGGLRGLTLTLAAVVAAFACAAFGGQDTWAGVERIVAVGDVHGDHEQFVKVLRAAKVIDAKHNWIAGKTHLVQTGDVLDRAPDSRKAIDLIMKLQKQASKAGGAVHPLIGNHEAMVLVGDWRYVHPGEVKAFGSERAYREAMGAKGKYGRWIRSNNTAVMINGLLFVHAGLTSRYASVSLAEINGRIRAELEKANRRGIAGDPRGPLWDRSLAFGRESAVARELDTVLKAFGARGMVIAHTVQTDGVVTRAGGRLIRIDVGMSRYYRGPAACLVVEKGVFYEVRHPDVKRRLDVKLPTTRPARAPTSRPARAPTSRPAQRPTSRPARGPATRPARRHPGAAVRTGSAVRHAYNDSGSIKAPLEEENGHETLSNPGTRRSRPALRLHQTSGHAVRVRCVRSGARRANQEGRCLVCGGGRHGGRLGDGAPRDVDRRGV